MTLIELLVVLALLVVIGGMVVPVFTGSFSSVRLRRAGDQVITRWSQARAMAIETGEVFQFRYKPETGSFQVEPWTGVLAESATSATATTGSAGSSTTTTATVSATTDAATGVATTVTADGMPTSYFGTLPDQVLFMSGQVAVEDALAGARRVDSLQSPTQDLTTPLLFFPDGTSSQGTVVLKNDREQYVRLTLRALTGVGRATEIMSREELDRLSGRR